MRATIHWSDGLILDQLLLEELDRTKPDSARLMREMFTVEERVAVIRHKAELILEGM